MSDVKPAFRGEMMLAGWSESHNGGAKVTFWLSDPSELDAFRAMTCRKGNTAGQRFAVMMVEIGDDEQPIPDVEGKAKAANEAAGPLCKAAAMVCADSQFPQFMRVRYPSSMHICGGDATKVFRKLCKVDSRKQLDVLPHSAKIAREIMRHFDAWKNKHGVK